MEHKDAIRALSSLGHDSRLAIFRLLVQAGEAGLAVGTIGERLGLAPATLSFHLAALRHAGTVVARREGRVIYHVADYAAMNDLVSYLSENCCQGADCGVAGCVPAGSKAASKSVKKGIRHEKIARPRRGR
jgi:ArsR family transcriptional regulator, arsenate/arsenite/antimonite-responsive transcriptional repressor